jgi:DNA-binding beta-propeller fold protein YncE
LKQRLPHRAVALAVVLLAMAASSVASAWAEAPPRLLAGDAPAHASIGFEPTPLSLATDAAGHVFLSNPQTSKQVQEYSSDGTLLASWGSFVLSGGFQARDITADAAGNLWVIDGEGGQVIELGNDGSVLRSWAAKGRDIAIGPTGDVYLVTADEVERYSPDGNLISKWDPPGKSGRGLGEAWGIDVGPDGLVYVAGTWGERIDVFEADGTFVRGWNAGGLPYGIAVAPTGDVYLADTGADQVQEFSPTGSLVRSWGSSGGRAGRFYTPTGIAVGPEGDVYVADAAEEYPDQRTARVQKFTPDGRFLTQWGDLPIARPRITAGPAPKTRSDSAVLAFSSPRKPAYFECRLQGPRVPAALKRIRRCSSPKSYGHLRPGHQVFEVFSVVDGRYGPASRRAWTVLPGS